jgi:hypothetical protein
MSQLKVNSIVPVGGLPSGANGGIIQTVNVVKTDAFSATTANSFTDISGLSLSITPSSNLSKILVLTGIYGQANASSGSAVKIVCSSGSAIIGTDVGSRVATNGGEAGDNNLPAHDVNPIHQNILLFSPSTTSAVTIKAQYRLEGSGTFFINRSRTSNNNTGYIRTVSTITAFEIT